MKKDIIRATIVEAARALNSQCDGAQARDKVGFNGADAPFAKSLLEQAYLSQKQLASLHRLLAKYAGQLARLGFIYSELAIPAPGPVPGAKQAELQTEMKVISETGVSIKTESFIERKADDEKLWPYKETSEVVAHFPQGRTPRPAQMDAIARINESFRSGKKVVVLEMPTGGGKSFICMTFANAMKAHGSTHFLTCQKLLQRQYASDFPSPAMEILMGRSNYPCTHPDADGSDAAHGVCTRQKKGILDACIDESRVGPMGFGENERSLRQRAVALELPACAHRCPYWEQLQKCHDHKITLFNFSSFLFQQRIGRFGPRALMMVDEGHQIESELMKFVSLELTEWALSIINVKITTEITSKTAFVEWLQNEDILRKIDQAIEDAADGSEDVPDDLSQVEADALKELQSKLKNFMVYLEKTEWILETQTYWYHKEERRKIVARPLFAKDFARELLFRHADRVLVMSATILDVKLWARNLGLSPEEVGHVQTGCEFPVENRTIHLTYAGNLGRKTLEDAKPKVVIAVKQILERHHGQRGMIHTQSFELSKLLREQVASPRFLFQDDFVGGKEEMLEAHKQRPDTVIVAPGMKEGVDLKDDLGRFQVILKIPYPSLGDKVVKERADRDPSWYGWITALGLIQSLGRIVRHKEDFGVTYILDAGMEGFMNRNGQMIPSWVRGAFRKYPPKEVRRA